MFDNNAPDRIAVQLPAVLHGITAAAHLLHAETERAGTATAAQEMGQLPTPVLAAVLATLDSARTSLETLAKQAQDTIQVPLPSLDVDAPTDATGSLAAAVSRLGHTEGGFPVALALLDPRDERARVAFLRPATFVVDFLHPEGGTVERHEVADLDSAAGLVEDRCLSTHTEVTIGRAVVEDGRTLITPVESVHADAD